MTVTLSAEAIRAMGFRPFEAGELITATFSSVSVYEARGISIPAETAEVTAGTIAAVSYRIAVGAGLNHLCLALLNDTYVEDEDEWKKEKKCSGPFVIIQLGPTRHHTIATGHVLTEKDGSASTFDSFPELRSELAVLEAAALPPLVTALSCLLGYPDIKQLELRKIDRTSVGRTGAGQVIRDLRIQLSANVVVSQGLQTARLAADIQEVATLAPQLNVKAARFFALGLGEEDELKKFLYFFLSLEVHTHFVFGRIDHIGALQRLIDSTLPPKLYTVALLQRQTDQIRNLFDRFVWCATCEWSNIDDADVEQFKKLKSARDNIAHGSASEPPPGYAKIAQLLAMKVLRC